MLRAFQVWKEVNGCYIYINLGGGYFHLCPLLHLHSLVLKSSPLMWDCCLLTHPSIRFNAAPPTHHFDCPTCWKGKPGRNREDREIQRNMSTKGIIKDCLSLMQNNINGSTLDFITTKTDTRHRQTQSCSNWRKAQTQQERDIKETLGAPNNHSFLLCITDSYLRLI